jgi:phage tail-like protein
MPPPTLDRFRSLKFRVKWDGRYVAGVTKVIALTRTTEVIEHREGGAPETVRTMPGRTRYEPIVLERGITDDRDFEQWANASGAHKDIRIELFNQTGQLVLAYDVFGCWVSEYDALELDASANRVAIERLRLENEGWQRDESVSEPTVPAFEHEGRVLGRRRTADKPIL